MADDRAGAAPGPPPTSASRSAAWHRRDPDAFRRLERAVADEFPGLYFEERGERLVLAGEFLVADAARVLDRYQIEIDVPRDGPASAIPVVREVGGRIPRTAARHMNGDGTACLGVPDEFTYRHPEGLDLIAFLRGPVLGYFLGQSLVADGGAWPHGERAHGAAGIVEFYAALAGTTDPARVHAFLEMATAKKIRARWRCPCGSRRPVHGCHGAALRRLRQRVPRRALRASAAAVARLAAPASPRPQRPAA